MGRGSNTHDGSGAILPCRSLSNDGHSLEGGQRLCEYVEVRCREVDSRLRGNDQDGEGFILRSGLRRTLRVRRTPSRMFFQDGFPPSRE